VVGHQRFGGPCCLHLQGEVTTQNTKNRISLKFCYIQSFGFAFEQDSSAVFGSYSVRNPQYPIRIRIAQKPVHIRTDNHYFNFTVFRLMTLLINYILLKMEGNFKRSFHYPLTSVSASSSNEINIKCYIKKYHQMQGTVVIG